MVLESFAEGFGAGAGSSLVNVALSPFNEMMQRRSMRYQRDVQKELTEHNADVTARLESRRNRLAMAEMMAGAEAAGVSPLTAFGGTPSAVGASSAPMPVPSGPQVSFSPSDAVAFANSRLLNAQAEKVENENEDTSGYRRTLQENLPRFFRSIETTDKDFKDYLEQVAQDIEANGTTKGALSGYFDSVVLLPKNIAEAMRDLRHAERDYKTFESQLNDKDVLDALKKFPYDERVKLYTDVRKLNSEIVLNGGRLALANAQTSEALESARKLFAEYCKISNSDFNTALRDGRFGDFLKIMLGNTANGIAAEAGSALGGLLPSGRARAGQRAVKTLSEKLAKSRNGYDRQTRQVMEWMRD